MRSDTYRCGWQRGNINVERMEAVKPGVKGS